MRRKKALQIIFNCKKRILKCSLFGSLKTAKKGDVMNFKFLLSKLVMISLIASIKKIPQKRFYLTDRHVDIYN